MAGLSAGSRPRIPIEARADNRATRCRKRPNFVENRCDLFFVRIA
jgi:hypothetical protein